jgi:hypothetical protein
LVRFQKFKVTRHPKRAAKTARPVMTLPTPATAWFRRFKLRAAWLMTALIGKPAQACRGQVAARAKAVVAVAVAVALPRVFTWYAAAAAAVLVRGVVVAREV